MLWEPEKRLLGLERLPSDTGTLPSEISGVEPDSTLITFLFWFINGPHLVSDGRGLNEFGCSTGFCFIILSLAFSAASTAFSLLNLISFHGLMLARKPCFLVKLEDSGSPLSIFIDRLAGF